MAFTDAERSIALRRLGVEKNSLEATVALEHLDWMLTNEQFNESVDEIIKKLNLTSDDQRGDT